MTITETDQDGSLWTVTFPPPAPGQTGWTVSGAANRYLQGETFIARDYFPKLYEIPIEEQVHECRIQQPDDGD